MNQEQLIATLITFLPENCILYKNEDMQPYECDGLSIHKQLPRLVLLPENIQQLQKIFALAYENKIPIVARGAGTGLSGGALPHKDALLVGLAKFNQILNIDLDNGTATVQPGVRNLAISQAVSAHGMYYAPDPSSQIACTIGGNVAENSGGVHCLKYGLTVHNILQLTILTIDGKLLTIGSECLDTPGYDFLALMTGSEGMLGIITEIVVKLLPSPENACVILAAFDDVSKAGNAVASIISAGIIPAGLEMMDKLATKAAEEFVQAGYPLNAEAILLCEVDGSHAEVQEGIEKIKNLMIKNDSISLRVSKDAAERELLWKGRKAAFPAVGRIAPDYYCMDGTIPRHQLAEVLKTIDQLSKKYALPVANVFHAGDGNLHPLILYDANVPNEWEKAEKFGAEILALCINVGGTITGEHGVGMEKLDQMCTQFSTPEIKQFHAIKHAFDPLGLLNPGKAVPELHRCAELGAMHVHNGELPFPELERF